MERNKKILSHVKNRFWLYSRESVLSYKILHHNLYQPNSQIHARPNISYSNVQRGYWVDKHDTTLAVNKKVYKKIFTRTIKFIVKN